MEPPDTHPAPNRLGFHYFPDSLHYTERHLLAWLPELDSLGAGWLTLIAGPGRAIPESFLSGLISSGIQPVVHLVMPADAAPAEDELRPLLRSYARWGLRYLALFDQPNSRPAWSPPGWAQNDLVERFLDAFIPAAQVAAQEGLTPVFPPLEPGGDYWDLVFLKAALRGILRRGRTDLLEGLVLGAYAWVGDRDLSWGAGGPARWPAARPYYTPPGEQDHLGFRIFDWYQAVAQAELGRRLPVILLRAGPQPPGRVGRPGKGVDPAAHAKTCLAIAGLVRDGGGSDAGSAPLPPEVLACNLWLLAADEGSPFVGDAFFQPHGLRLPVVDELRLWANLQGNPPAPFAPPAVPPDDSGAGQEAPEPVAQVGSSHPIAHYILLPLYSWGAAEWELGLIEPLLNGSHPAVGFSLEEASLARRVTVVGGEWAFSDQALQALRVAGCTVERLLADGTIVAP